MLKPVQDILGSSELFISHYSNLLAKNSGFVQDRKSNSIERIFEVEIDVQGFEVSAILYFSKLFNGDFVLIPNFQMITVKPPFFSQEQIVYTLERAIKKSFFN